MKFLNAFLTLSFLSLMACSAPGEAGDACETDADCADGLECHVHDHDDEDHDAEEHDESAEAGGVCEAHDDDEAEE